MKPYIDIFDFQLPTYGLMMMLGAIIAIAVALLRTKRKGLVTMDVLHIGLLCVAFGIVGAKILYLIVSIPEIIEAFQHPISLMSFLSGGMVFYGGFIGGLAALVWYVRKYKLDILAYMDLYVPSVALAHAFGRVGCFLAGCCYGIPFENGVVFHDAVSAPNGVPVLPVQLIEAGINALLFIALVIVSNKTKIKGRTTGVYFISYSIIRFALEFFRGDLERGVYGGISTSQIISILLFLAGLAFCFAVPRIIKTKEAQNMTD